VIRKIILFAVVFSALQLTWQASAESTIARAFIEKAVVAPAAFTVNVLTPDAHATATGSHLRARGGGINIINGCDGMDLLFLLIAGFAVAPLSARSRLLGILTGVPLVYVLNQTRILALFYSSRVNTNLFDALHGFIAPIVVILVIAGYFYVWLYHMRLLAPAHDGHSQ
jgi:exosortase family protein XrtM